MIDCGSPPSNQMQLELPGLNAKGEKRMKEARNWAAMHWKEFNWYKNLAYEQGENASPNFCLQAMRNHFHVSIPNAYAPYLARIAMEQNKSIHFRLARSDADGFTKVCL